MSRNTRIDIGELQRLERKKALKNGIFRFLIILLIIASPLFSNVPPAAFFLFAFFAVFNLSSLVSVYMKQLRIENERKAESLRRKGKEVLGLPPQRDCVATSLAELRAKGKTMIDKYLVGFNLDTGEPLWIDEEDLCSHACVFAKTGVGKTLFLESIIFQQMLRGRASGCTFIDAKRDSGTLAQVILMALVTGRIEDLIVVDPFDPVHAYNFLLTDQRADVKARKVLRAGLPPTSDASSSKHYDRLAADSIARMVRALESFGLSWSIHDIAVALSAFQLAYPHIRNMLEDIKATQALVELGHLASSYRTAKGTLDAQRLTDNLRGISSELHAISGSEMGAIFCTNYTDLVLTDAMLRGKIIYFMLPRLEEAEGAARMVKVFREDLEIAIGEITSSRQHNLEDPHLVIVDEGSSTFGPTWANLFELARKGRFALLFGAQSTGGLTDDSIGLSEAFYERVMANVNLKVMMRIGDNRTAQDMAEWFGKVATTKKSVGAGLTTGTSSSVMRGAMDFNAKQTGGESQSISFSEDEEYLVSPEELKHEMSAEKGLAWFDLGNGKIVKGRSFWFNSEVPDTWEGREFLQKLERYERDEIGLGDWVDKQILTAEANDRLGRDRFDEKNTEGNFESDDSRDNQKLITDDSAFKLNLSQPGPNRGAVRAFSMPATTEDITNSDSNNKIEDTKNSQNTDTAPVKSGPKGRFGLKR
jgi:hypothetical protein